MPRGVSAPAPVRTITSTPRSFSFLFDAYGPKRCYWGSDMTDRCDKATYIQRITHFTEELPFLSEEDKDWVMGKSILARLRWA
jgi:hypothetical protein